MFHYHTGIPTFVISFSSFLSLYSLLADINFWYSAFFPFLYKYISFLRFSWSLFTFSFFYLLQFFLDVPLSYWDPYFRYFLLKFFVSSVVIHFIFWYSAFFHFYIVYKVFLGFHDPCSHFNFFLTISLSLRFSCSVDPYMGRLPCFPCVKVCQLWYK